VRFGGAYAERFDDVYRAGGWGGEKTRSTGAGGFENALSLAPVIEQIIRDLLVDSVLDVGCGEGLWMPDMPRGVRYVGVDVSQEALSVAREKHPERDYRLYGGGDLPVADLVICKHVFQHMSTDDGIYLLERIRGAGKWLAATTFTRGGLAEKVEGALGYHPDLSAEPFALGAPLSTWEEGHARQGDKAHGGRFALWDLR
jgi:SAM-dependent methyltransferase